MNWKVLKQTFIYHILAMWQSLSLPPTPDNKNFSLIQVLRMSLGLPISFGLVDFAHTKLLACKGDIKSQYDIADILMYKSSPSGIGCPVDTKERQIEAIEWYKEAANQGDIESQYCLGYIYDLGEGYIRQDTSEALKWYKKAADQGDKHSKSRVLSILGMYEEELKNSDSFKPEIIKFININYKI